MIEELYYELCLREKFKKTNLRGKLKQFYEVAKKYFLEDQCFSFEEISLQRRQKIERKILKRNLNESEYDLCKMLFADKDIVYSIIRSRLKKIEEKENEIDQFPRLKTQQQNRLLIYYYFLRRTVEQGIESKWSIPYLKYLLDNDIDTECVPEMYNSISLDEYKKRLTKKGVDPKTLEE